MGSFQKNSGGAKNPKRIRIIEVIAAAALVLAIAFYIRSTSVEVYDGSAASAAGQTMEAAAGPAASGQSAVSPGQAAAPEKAASGPADKQAEHASEKKDEIATSGPVKQEEGTAVQNRIAEAPQEIAPAAAANAQTAGIPKPAEGIPVSAAEQKQPSNVIIAGDVGISYGSSPGGGRSSGGGSSSSGTEPAGPDVPETTVPVPSEPEPTQPETSAPVNPDTPAGPEKPTDPSGRTILSCTLAITCEPFLDDTSDAVRAKLPADGIILDETEVEFYEGDTVFDVLKRVCRAKQIPYKNTTTFYGAYINSMDNLSEKYYDYSTGWCYYVDGEYATKSSDAWVLEGGEHIEWVYDSWSA